jgi:hypothetical protein
MCSAECSATLLNLVGLHAAPSGTLSKALKNRLLSHVLLLNLVGLHASGSSAGEAN